MSPRTRGNQGTCQGHTEWEPGDMCEGCEQSLSSPVLPVPHFSFAGTSQSSLERRARFCVLHGLQLVLQLGGGREGGNHQQILSPTRGYGEFIF